MVCVEIVNLAEVDETLLEMGVRLFNLELLGSCGDFCTVVDSINLVISSMSEVEFSSSDKGSSVFSGGLWSRLFLFDSKVDAIIMG